ncbi:MAG: hypothetical protein WBB76_00605 [Gaiellaceae bacterium]
MARVRCAAALLAALALCGSAGARNTAAAPQGLHGFVLRADEPIVHTFARTPSFGWSPVAGARAYQFELATSKRFSDSGIIWSAKGLTSPAVSVPISLPWMSGQPYSLYAHARAITQKGPGPWSAAFGFNMRWPAIPTPLTPSYPGLLRWNPVPGASGYMVWLVDTGKWFTTRTNMADEREYYTFHQGASWTGVVHWRVRATRWLYGKTANGIPSVSYGPWSPVYTSTNPPFATGPLTAQATVSNVVSDAATPRVHGVMPAFLYSGNTSIWGTTHEFYRVEVFTDQDCLNPVFRGAIVGSPAYVPREVGPLALPTDVNGVANARTSYLSFGAEPTTKTADGLDVTTNEMDILAGSANNAHTGLPASQMVNAAKIDLWDSDWPGSRYYWTVMPVDAVADQQLSTVLATSALAGATTITVVDATGIVGGDVLQIGAPSFDTAIVKAVSGNDITLASGLPNFHPAGDSVVRPSGGVKYRDAELTQDACASGRMLTFGKSSQPAVTGQTTPFISGLSPDGKLVAAASSKPRFYGPPLVAWQPTVSTDQYEVQWSHTTYPWRTAGSLKTWATSVTLPLTPGVWYYRVRGLDYLMSGSKPQLSWSAPVRLIVTKPRFRLVP